MLSKIDQYSLIIRSMGENLITKYEACGRVETGVNGPYNDKETNVRNLSHLIVITSIELIVFGRIEYRPILEQLSKDLLSYEENGLYVMRNKEGKDKCNGVIGHAWVMEAYIYLYKSLNDEFFLQKAYQIYKRHDFNKKIGLWHRPAKECNYFAIDYTLNHQLWFAAISSELYQLNGNLDILNDIELFMKLLKKNMGVDSDGLILHFVKRKIGTLSRIKMSIKISLESFRRLLRKPSYLYKELGYHSFNIVAFARLKLVLEDNSFWESKIFRKALEFISSGDLANKLLNSDFGNDISLNNELINDYDNAINVYGFPYNVTGFEILYIGSVFKNNISGDLISEFLDKQFLYTYDEEHNCLGINCFDRVTINYRIYEYYKVFELF